MDFYNQTIKSNTSIFFSQIFEIQVAPNKELFTYTMELNSRPYSTSKIIDQVVFDTKFLYNMISIKVTFVICKYKNVIFIGR